MPDAQASALEQVLSSNNAQMHVYQAPPGISSPSAARAIDSVKADAGLVTPTLRAGGIPIVDELIEYPAKQPSSAYPSVRLHCDRCEEPIEDVRLRCRNCPNFDYCPGCFLDVDRIHPLHKFAALRGYEELEPEDQGFYLALRLGNDNPISYPYLLRGNTTESPPKPCPSCKMLALHLPTLQLFMRDPKFCKDIPQVQSRGLATPWNVKLTKLTEASAMGCAFCTFILEKFFGPSNAWSFLYSPERPWYTDLAANPDRHKQLLENTMRLVNVLPHDRFNFRVSPECNESKTDAPWLDKLVIAVDKPEHDVEILKRAGVFAFAGKLSIELHVCTPENDQASIDVRNRPPNANPASSTGLARAKDWVKECTEKHGQSCPALGLGQTSRLPSRVIDVSSGTSLRLYESEKDEMEAYTALSYQWGGPQQFLATTATLPRLLDGFSIDDLPATIADAVRVTQKLGIHYLWVDAICIIQDDVEDKAHEISCMGGIYRNACLTIIAAQAFAVEEGFLASKADPETGLWKAMIPLKYPIVDPGATTIQEAFETPRSTYGTIWLMDEMESMGSQTFNDPVAKRGWCLQERLLSPRVLNYGRWPTWRCSKTIASDGGFYPTENTTLIKQDEFARQLLRMSKQLDLPTDLFMVNKLLKAWYGVVMDYTRRELSVVSDRLAAIGGIASLMSQVIGSEYLAGLWRNNLLHDMMWYANTREWLDRPETWRAPTWSWASIECSVSYRHMNVDATPLATVLAADVKPGAAGPFGEIKFGQLQVRGPMREVPREDVLRLLKNQGMADPPPKSNSIQDWYKLQMEHIASIQRAKNLSMEEVSSMLPSRVFALVTYEQSERILYEEQQEGKFYSGLLLRQVDDHYERIGSFKHEALKWLNLGQEEIWREDTITIR